MTASWEPVRLGDLVRVKHGYAFSGMSENVPSPAPVVVAIGNFDYSGGFRFGSTTVKRYTGDYPADFRLEPGDVLLAMTCQTAGGEILGIPGRVPDDNVVYLHNQRLGKIEITDTKRLDLDFMYQLARWASFNQHLYVTASGSKILHTSPTRIEEFSFDLPTMGEQRGIAATLGALDDKIESNRRAGETLRQLGKAEVKAHIGTRRSILKELVLSISRGVTPKYADSDPTAPLVLNQRCIRDNWISAEAARHMNDRSVVDAKHVSSRDILVNSTGTGTLGRVGRWHQGGIFADSHISIVKPDASKIGPTVLAYLLFDREGDIEDMATGSTGQTELSPSRLGQLELALPSAEDVEELEPILAVFEDRAASLQIENNHLAAIRDSLLPELLSGRIRVPEAFEAVEEVVA